MTSMSDPASNRPQQEPAVAASRAIEDYLTHIWKAEEWGGQATTGDLAASLEVTPSTVSSMLRKLARDGFISYAPYGEISLTESGRDVALPVVRRHRIIETYLVDRLGFGWDEVHIEADALEHAVSDRVLDRLDAVLGYPARDPHGDLIPRTSRNSDAARALQLRAIPVGSRGQVTRISDRSSEILRYLAGRGITVETNLELRSIGAETGVVEVLTEEGLTELAPAVADAIWVTPADGA